MRRSFIEEEEAPTRLAPIPQEASEWVAGQLPTQEAPQKSAKATPSHREKNAPLKGKLLKGGIIAFAALGIVSLVLPPLLGVPLNELAQSVNLKSAYSSTSLTQVRANAAIKLGNLGAATDALVTLTPGTTEATDISIALFPRLLEAKEYERAAQVLRYLSSQKPQTTSPGLLHVPVMTDNIRVSSVSTYEIGTRMQKDLGLEKAIAQVEKGANLLALRQELLPPMFYAAGMNELSALVKIAPTLQPGEQYQAVLAILGRYAQAKDWDKAWSLASSLPPQYRAAAQGNVLKQMADLSTDKAVERLVALQSAPEFASLLDDSLTGLGEHPHQASQFVHQLKPSPLRDQVVRLLLTQFRSRLGRFTPQEVISMLELQGDPAIKAWTLAQAGLIENNVEKESPAAQKEFGRKELLPRLTEMALQHPGLQPLHLELQRYYSSPAKTGVAGKQLETPLLDKLRGEKFKFTNPTNAATLTGLRG